MKGNDIDRGTLERMLLDPYCNIWLPKTAIWLNEKTNFETRPSKVEQAIERKNRDREPISAQQ